jgi:hypothetical protein
MVVVVVVDGTIHKKMRGLEAEHGEVERTLCHVVWCEYI